MKANHLLTRLRQDLRKMVLNEADPAYSRYRHFATGKIIKLREQYKRGKLTELEMQAFRDCAVTFVEIVSLHDEQKPE